MSVRSGQRQWGPRTVLARQGVPNPGRAPKAGGSVAFGLTPLLTSQASQGKGQRAQPRRGDALRAVHAETIRPLCEAAQGFLRLQSQLGAAVEHRQPDPLVLLFPRHLARVRPTGGRGRRLRERPAPPSKERRQRSAPPHPIFILHPPPPERGFGSIRLRHDSLPRGLASSPGSVQSCQDTAGRLALRPEHLPRSLPGGRHQDAPSSAEHGQDEDDRQHTHCMPPRSASFKRLSGRFACSSERLVLTAQCVVATWLFSARTPAAPSQLALRLDPVRPIAPVLGAAGEEECIRAGSDCLVGWCGPRGHPGGCRIWCGTFPLPAGDGRLRCLGLLKRSGSGHGVPSFLSHRIGSPPGRPLPAPGGPRCDLGLLRQRDPDPEHLFPERDIHDQRPAFGDHHDTVPPGSGQ
jgi:hypothetical protein